MTSIDRLTTSEIAAQYAAVDASRDHLRPFALWLTDEYSLADAEQWATSVQDDWNAGREFVFIIRNNSGELVGTIGLHSIDEPNGCCEIGYWIAANHLRKGHASRAVSQIVDWGRREHRLERFEFVLRVDNEASRGVARASGATRETTLRSRLRTREGDRIDAELWVLIVGPGEE